MERFYPKMQIRDNRPEDEDDMFIVHEHAFNICRNTILGLLDEILMSRRNNVQEDMIQMADFGTADGKTSLSIINEIIVNVRSRLGKKKPVMVYYNDQVMNDFNILGRVLKGDGHAPGLLYDTNVYAAMIPRTMYEQCLPNKCLDLSFCSMATHFLSTQVCNLRNGISIETADQKERQLMAEQAKHDWRSFVISRGRELKPGGHLITISPATNEEGKVLERLMGGMKTISGLIRNMIDDEVITEQEFIAMNLSGYFRTEQEFCEPFQKSDPDVEELGLEILSIKTHTRFLQHPIFHVTNKSAKDKKKYAERVVSSIRPWMHHAIYGGLSDSRTDAQKEDIMSHFWSKLYTYVYNNSDHKPYLVFSIIVIKRSRTIV